MSSVEYTFRRFVGKGVSIVRSLLSRPGRCSLGTSPPARGDGADGEGLAGRDENVRACLVERR